MSLSVELWRVPSAILPATRGVVDDARAIATTASDREVTFLAASIAYYTFVSLIPLLVLAVVVTTFFGGAAMEERITAAAGAYLLPTGQQLIEGALENQTGAGSVSVVSFLLTVWGALKVFRGFDVAFSRIYGSEPGGIVDQITDGLVAILSVGLGLAVAVAVTATVALLNLPFVRLLSPMLLLATLFTALFPFYYVFPDLQMPLREAAPGAAFAAFGWTVLSTAFGFYAANASGVSGALGAILLLLTWFYFGGTLLLVGGVINAVLGGRLIDRQLQLGGGRRTVPMSDDRERPRTEPRGAPDISELDERISELRADLDAFESDVDERTVDRPQLEAELERYVRKRMRRGHARGWGPYLVLLYGTVMTLGAFYFLDGLYAIAAMIVLFLSTLGLYVLFLVVGVGLNVTSLPSRIADIVRKRRG